METYDAVAEYTFVDEFRCYELWTLVEQSAKLSGDIIEVGIWRGGSGAIIAKKAELCGIRGTVFLCDTFKGVVKARPKDTFYEGGEHGDTTRQIVERLIFGQFELRNVVILEGIFPDETAHLLGDRQFRLCHIDVDVYRSAKDIIDWIWAKLVIGGIVIFDDYGFKGCEGITKYVEEQTLRKDCLLLYNLNGHAILI